MNAVSDFEVFWIGTGWSGQGSSEHRATEFGSTFMKLYTQVTRYKEERRIWKRGKKIRVPLLEECARKKKTKKQKAPQTYCLDRSASQDELLCAFILKMFCKWRDILMHAQLDFVEIYFIILVITFCTLQQILTYRNTQSLILPLVLLLLLRIGFSSLFLFRINSKIMNLIDSQ
jgi:hypothetical protein